MSRKRVVVLDYGSGNVHSAVKALARAGADVELSKDAAAVFDADGLLVPGVGAFAAVMQQLRRAGGADMVARRLAAGRPVMGICVGQQVMFERGIERGATAEGLGRWPGTVRELTADVLPHMGWSRVDTAPGSTLFRGLEDEMFYFVHSCAATESFGSEGAVALTAAPRITWSEHGERFIAAVEDGLLSSTQFHPEKSGEAGIQLLRNWIASF